LSDRHASTHQRILRYNRAARLLLILAIAAGFCAALIVVVQAWLLSDVVNRIFILRQTLTDVLPFLFVMLLLAFVRAACVWSNDVLAQRSATHLKDRLRSDLTQRLFTLGPAFTRTERSGELVNTVIEGVEVLDEYMTLFQPLRFLAMIVPVCVALVVFVLDPPTVLILILTGPVLVLFLALIGSRAKEITERRFLELSWMSAFFLDMLQGLATLKMFGRSREQIETIREISQHYGNTTLEVLRTAFQTALVLEWGGTVATALVAVEISLRLMSGGIPFERALAVLIITPEFFFPLRQLAIRYHAGTAGKAAADRIFAILDTPATFAKRDASSHKPLLSMTSTRLDIRFDRVFFAYDHEQRPALRDFSLHIPHGQKIAVVGATGAGKTTVANLLLRFVEPQAGSITADGVLLSEIDPATWRSQVAWVPQQPHLFYGTVAENIRLAKSNATRDEISAAAQAAHAHEFIEKLPQGYDTPIGEQGARLSGGQQQRLAIARAFLKDAPLLILDEATSHLDAESEALIQDALDRLLRDRTVLIIAHRLKLVYTADCVVIMEQGRALETGTHQSLWEQGGAYQRLVASYEGGAQ
jgi:ATP-binding cassette, subfamily C, bacterial CydD